MLTIDDQRKLLFLLTVPNYGDRQQNRYGAGTRSKKYIAQGENSYGRDNRNEAQADGRTGMRIMRYRDRHKNREVSDELW